MFFTLTENTGRGVSAPCGTEGAAEVSSIFHKASAVRTALIARANIDDVDHPGRLALGHRVGLGKCPVSACAFLSVSRFAYFWADGLAIGVVAATWRFAYLTRVHEFGGIALGDAE